MKVILTGATGFVGTHVVEALLKKGHDVVVLTRSPERAKARLPFPIAFVAWDLMGEAPSATALLDADAVIHLAGESVAARWTESVKKRIYDSRVVGTRNLVQGLRNLQLKQGFALITASAIGIYGDRGDEILYENAESSVPGEGFLEKVCRDWEHESLKLTGPGLRDGVRTVVLRIGMVLGIDGGALQKMVPLFKKYLGGAVGSGKQWMSWIHLQDLVNLIVWALENPATSGVYNAVAPGPETNRAFSSALGTALKKPSNLPAPAAALSVALGEMSQMVLASQRVLPKRAVDAGFHFKFASLAPALHDLFPDDNAIESDRLIFQQWVKRPLAEVFDFFSDEKNLEVLTPPWLQFHVLGKSTPQIEEGSLIDYQLKLHGVPVRWQSRIDKWEPGKSFVDTQTKGPYKLWHHTHVFEAMCGGTLMTDRIFLQVPAGILGRALVGRWVKSDVQKIFNYRRQTIEVIFGS